MDSIEKHEEFSEIIDTLQHASFNLLSQIEDKALGLDDKQKAFLGNVAIASHETFEATVRECIHNSPDREIYISLGDSEDFKTKEE